MNIVFKSVLIFLTLLAASSLLIEYFGYEFGTVNYFDKRGVFFLFFVTLFPRLTLLFSSVPFGGIAWWLGWIFCPRFLVAILATVNYFQTNPILVVMSWLVAFGGEGLEKWTFRPGRVSFYYHGQTYGRPKNTQSTNKNHIGESDTIEAEFRRK